MQPTAPRADYPAGRPVRGLLPMQVKAAEETLASLALGGLLAEVRGAFGLAESVQFIRRTRRPDLDEPDATPRLWVWSLVLPGGGQVAIGLPGLAVDEIRLRARDLSRPGPRPSLSVDGQEMVWQQAVPVIAELLTRPPGPGPATVAAAAGLDPTAALAGAMTRAAQLLMSTAAAHPGLPPLTHATLDAPPGGEPVLVASPPRDYVPSEQVRAVRYWARALAGPIAIYPAGGDRTGIAAAVNAARSMVVETRAALPVGGKAFVLCVVPPGAARAVATPVDAYTEGWGHE